MPQPGDVIGRKYRIDRQLGQGGMGVVFAATDLTLRRAVAIKQLLPSLRGDEDCVARFLREARAAVTLTSEHTVRVYDVGEDANGVPFMVMEYLSGSDLNAVVGREGRLPVERAVGYILQAVEGIAEAHVAGIVHRDLKPQNLFLTQRADGADLVKVLDFGLAKAPVGEGERSLTATSAVMGSPEYMSPEQTRGSRDVDVRTDVWALGACLYELVTGGVPFSASNVSDIIVKILTEAPVPPHVIYPDIPVGLSRVILRCLEKDVDARFAHVGELASALQEYAPPGAEGVSDRVVRILLGHGRPPAVLAAIPHVADADDEPSDTKTEAIYDSGPERRKKRLLWRIAGGGAILGATVGAMLVYRVPPHPASEPTRAPAQAVPSAIVSAEEPALAVPSGSIEPAVAVSARPSEVRSAAPRLTAPRPTSKKPSPPPSAKRPAEVY